MFWVGISLLVMSLTGLGDDTRSFLRFWERLERAAQAEVAEPQRKAQVTSAFAATREGFKAQRAMLKKVGDCVEKLDHRYDATQEEYLACGALGAGAMQTAAEVLVQSRERFRAATTDQERARIRAQVLDK